MANQGAAAVKQTQQAVERLINAVQNGNVAELKTACKALGGTAEAIRGVRDSLGRGMLHYAAQFDQCHMAEHLIKQQGFAVDDQDNAGESPLALAAAANHLSAVNLLMSLGADPTIRKSDTSTAPIHRAAVAGDAAGKEAPACLVALLEDQRVSVDTSSSTGTPLCWAAGAGHIESVKFLLSKGADPNHRGSNTDGMPALSLAAGAGSLACVQALLSAGAHVSAVGVGGATALHVAAAVKGKEDDSSQVVKQLLDAGADANAKDQAGFTPIEVAIASGNLQVAALLLPATQPFEGVSPWGLQQLVSHVSAVIQRKAAESKQETGQQIIIPQPEQPDAAQAATCKRQGDEAFVKGDYSAAIEAYSQSLQHDTNTAVVWANRAAAYLRLGQGQAARQDAAISRTIDPKYVKAWYREGAAFELLQQWEDAAAAFYEGLNHAPGNKDLETGFQRAIRAGQEAYQAAQKSKT